MNINLSILMRNCLLIICCILCLSCDRYLSIDPPVNQLSPQSVFDNDDAANSAIAGIYSRMIGSSSAGSFANGAANSVATLCGTSADEFINYNINPSNLQFYQNALIPTNPILSNNLWAGTYQYIYSSNAVIEGLKGNTRINSRLRNQLEGEAKFIRAFCYFYLTNLFGDIPMHLTTDYRVNISASKSSQSKIYLQIIEDLKDAISLLGQEYLSTKRIRPNKSAARAMLSRVYLYTGNFIEAEALATNIINDASLYRLESDLGTVFKETSNEAIWQLIPNSSGLNTNEGNLHILTGTPTQVSLSQNLVNEFDLTDKRRTQWIGNLIIGTKTYYYAFKYKVKSSATLTEYAMVLRLAEQYLIRAESRINLDKIELGIADLNSLRTRARASVTTENPNPLPPLATNMNKADALLAIERERRIELFAEWGHRWLDLKRTNRATTVLSSLKGANWKSTNVLFPIPQNEINANPQITQNNGY